LSRTGSYFNHLSRTCSVGDAPSSCSSVKSDYICIGKSTGNYKDMNAVQCATYYECTNQNGVRRTCPQNAKFYNIASGSCQATNPPGQSCEGAANPCAGKSNGYYPMDDTCNGGRYCLNEADVFQLPCTNNQLFDKSRGMCVSRVPENCQHPTCASNGASYQFTENTDSCSIAYFQCDANKYAVRRNCDLSRSGSYFDHVNRVCASGNAPSTCGASEEEYICIGKSNGNYEDSNAVECGTHNFHLTFQYIYIPLR
jgi:hypothetical protein